MFNSKNKNVAAVVCSVCVVASGFIFGTRSVENLKEVDPRLQTLAQCALKRSPVDFVVIDGGRSAAEHKKNVENGKSWIKRSRHQDGKAIDFAAYVNKQITYSPQPYHIIAQAFYSCSKELKTPIIWGGEWKAQDLMHIELDRKFYP